MKRFCRSIIAAAMVCAMLLPGVASSAEEISPQIDTPSISTDASTERDSAVTQSKKTSESPNTSSSTPSDVSTNSGQDSKRSSDSSSSIAVPNGRPPLLQSSGPSLPAPGTVTDSVKNQARSAEPKTQSDRPIVRGGAPDITVRDMLDSDAASVTTLRLGEHDGIITGTKPFDSNDQPGNDSGANNLVVRSFDRVTYNYDFAVSPDDPMVYYKSARVGFRFELPYPAEKAGFAMDAMGWVDRTPGYEPKVTTETIDGVPTQVLTAYRLLVPTSTSPTTVPGTAGISLVVDVKAAEQGETIQPKVTAWAAPNDTQHRAKTDTPQVVTVSAKLNLNLRISRGSSEISPELPFDFGRSDAGFVNHGLGKRTGMMGKVNWAVDMRWPDQSKGVRGLEKPKGPVKFNITASARWKKNRDQSTPEPARADLQPYLWDWSRVERWYPTVHPGRDMRDDGWYPRGDNWDYAGSSRGNPASSVYQNGSYDVAQDRRADKTVMSFTLSDYDINGIFPRLGVNYDSNTCTDLFMSSGCVTQKMGEVSTGYLFMFFPTQVQNGSGDWKSVVDLYGRDSVTLQVDTKDGGLAADSVTPGDSLATVGADDASNQAADNDDTWSAAALLTPPGSFSNRINYACLTTYSRENGTDCGGWNSVDAFHGTDTAVVGSTARIFVAANITTAKRDLPVGVVNLVKFDPAVFDVPERDALDLHADDPSRPSGIPGWADWQSPETFGKKPVDVFYAVKANGASWRSDREQNDAGMNDLQYYPSKAEAASHGTVVALLFVGHSTPDATKVGHYTTYIVGSLKMPIREDAPVGSVAQLTESSYAYSRRQLADAGLAKLDGQNLDPVSSSDDDWERFANGFDPFAQRSSLAPVYTAPEDGIVYQKAKYDSRGYLGGDTGGILYGDSLYVAGEQPHIDKAVEQVSEDGRAKSVFDLDKEQRRVDWALTASVATSAGGAAGSATTDVQVTDTLPKGMSYVEGSAKVGGEYRAGDASGGSVVGGTLAPPSVVRNANGTTTLKWTLPRVPVDGSKTVIHYSSTIGDPLDPAHDTKNGDSLENVVSVKSTRNVGEPNPAMGTQKAANITVSRTHASSIGIRADPLVADVSENLGFKMTLSNMAQNEQRNPYAVNIMPYTGDGSPSNFHGSYQVKGLKVTGVAGGSLGTMRVFFSNDPTLRDKPVSSISRAEMMGWTEAVVNRLTGEVTVPNGFGTPVAWGITSDSLPSLARYDVALTFTPSGNRALDIYSDRWMTDTNMVEARTHVVRRVVSGIAWFDYNGDGRRDDGDPVMKGVKVALVKADGTPVASLASGNPLTAVTGDDGAYSMVDVPAGSGYKLKFEPADGTSWGKLKLTKRNAAGVPRAANSGSTANLDGDGKLTSASIGLDEFPKASKMASSLYEDVYENSGLTGPMPYDGVADFVLRKNLIGRLENGWLVDESYTFDIKAVGSAPETGTDGPLPSSVTIKQPHREKTVPVKVEKFRQPGTYQYTVTERETTQPNVAPDPSASHSFTITVKISEDVSTLKRSVEITLTDEKGSPVSAAEFVNRYTAPVPGYAFSKTSDPVTGSKVMPGQTITYTLEGRNTGETALSEVLIDDDLSDVLKHADLVGQPVSDVGDAPTVSGTTLSWKGSLALGASVHVTYKVRIHSGEWDTKFKNRAKSQATPPADEPPAGVVPPAVEPIVPPAAQTEHYTPKYGYAFSKTSDPVTGSKVMPGQTITYTLEGRNTGGTDLPEVLIDDDLSDVLKHADLVGQPVSDVGDAPVVSGSKLTWKGALAEGTSVHVVYKVRVYDGDRAEWNVSFKNRATSQAMPPGEGVDPIVPPAGETEHHTPPRSVGPKSGPLSATGSGIVGPAVLAVVFATIGLVSLCGMRLKGSRRC